MTTEQQRIKDFARWVYETRKQRGYSQPDLQRRGGPSLGWIGELEAGKMTTSPKRSTLKKLAHALGVPYRDVLLAAGELEPGPVVMERPGDAHHDEQEPGKHDESMVSASLAPGSQSQSWFKDSKDNQQNFSLGGNFAVPPPSGVVFLPVFGVVSCGEPSWMPDQAIDFLPLSASAAEGVEAAIQVRGSSMVGCGYFDGDMLLVRRLDGERPNSGDDVIVCIEGEYTCAVYRADELGEYLEKRPDFGEAKRYPIKGETRIHALVIWHMTRKRK